MSSRPPPQPVPPGATYSKSSSHDHPGEEKKFRKMKANREGNEGARVCLPCTFDAASFFQEKYSRDKSIDLAALQVNATAAAIPDKCLVLGQAHSVQPNHFLENPPSDHPLPLAVPTQQIQCPKCWFRKRIPLSRLLQSFPRETRLRFLAIVRPGFLSQRIKCYRSACSRLSRH